MDDFTIDNVAIRKVGIYFPKFSIIAFYFNLVPISQPNKRIALYCLAGLTTSFAVITFFCDWFWCGPDPSANCQGKRRTEMYILDIHDSYAASVVYELYIGGAE
ncbi:hypothetical protein NW760_003304 [Fusarium oxysporum]|nr:hypothetical protein NW760_003304 [Fusarium oxysporum]